MVYNNVTVIGCHDSDVPGVYSSGAYVGGELLPDSLTTTNPRTESYKKLLNFDNYKKGEYIWGGYLFDHFGHFILESLAFMPGILSCPETCVIWVHSIPGKKKVDMLPYQKEILDMIGFKNPFIIINENEDAVFESINIPQQGYRFWYSGSVGYFKTLSVNTYSNTGRKVWMSRRDVPGGYVNEYKIESRLADHGWEIVDPLTYSVPEMVKILSSAEKVGLVEGSAFYNILFVDNPQFKLHIVCRRDELERDFEICCKGKNINAVVTYPKKMLVNDTGDICTQVYELLDVERICKELLT